MSNLTAGVIVGRFQVPYLHSGHLGLISKVCDHHNTIIIFLGISPVIGSKRDPLNFQCRQDMIYSSIKPLLKEGQSLIVLPIADSQSDNTWSDNLDHKIREVFPLGSVTLYGSRDSFISHYTGKFKNIEELSPDKIISGTQIRDEISSKLSSSQDFRSGVIYSIYNQYDRVTPTVDVALFLGDGSLVLGKKPDELLYRFVGGFVSPTDQSYEAAARRECTEETGVECEIEGYIGSFLIDDWRYRSADNRIITTFFEAKKVFGKLQANDDISELRVFNLADLNEDMIMPVHRPLFKKLIEKKLKTPLNNQ